MYEDLSGVHDLPTPDNTGPSALPSVRALDRLTVHLWLQHDVIVECSTKYNLVHRLMGVLLQFLQRNVKATPNLPWRNVDCARTHHRSHGLGRLRNDLKMLLSYESVARYVDSSWLDF